jgi:hypothetical protein
MASGRNLSESLIQACCVRVLISGQRDGHVDEMLIDCLSTGLGTEIFHLNDIEAHTRSGASEIQVRFDLEVAEENDIV